MGLRAIWVRAAAGLAVLALAAGAALAKPPKAAALTAADKADLARIEAYLNDITTVRARFLQASSNGGYAEGKVYVSRPGRLRFEYDPPVPVLIVADGSWLIYQDKELDQVSHLPLDSTPAGILVRPNVSFAGELVVTSFQRQAGTLTVTVTETKNPEMGTLALVFEERPLSLKKWIVTDSQGVTTTVALQDVRFGMPLESDLFKFEYQPAKPPDN
jgi:outer membrane lipoprotein-sorting protein